MKVGARKTLIETAEKNGIPWRERADALKSQNDKLSQFATELSNSAVVDYPEYYTQEFHAYDEGNLNWQAAYECESATMSMALRVWPKDGLSAEEAQDRLRDSFSTAVKSYLAKSKKSNPSTIIDMGCSIGISTFYLARAFPKAKVIDGLDLSTYFLAVAKQRQEMLLERKIEGALGENEMSKFADVNVKRIKWIHGYAEKTGVPSGRYDLTTASFMFHELPTIPADNIINEMYRITASGGTVAITDNNPKSPVIQGLPPALFTLMKSTVRVTRSCTSSLIVFKEHLSSCCT
jgi:ubiquinone/menaquinone biosynthesis C-methylase UbiE